MMKKIFAVIGTIMLVLLPVVVTYYLNNIRKPDVRYILSGAIPLSFSISAGSNYENIQQLEVKNVGSVQAEKIVINIEKPITEYDIKKYIPSDTVEVYSAQNSVQFIYPALPPQAEFKIVLRSPESISYSDIVVSHNSGIGTEALAPDKGNWANYVPEALFLAATMLYLATTMFTARSSFIDSWKSVSALKRLDLLLAAKKPWYVTSSEWPSIHSAAIKHKVKDEYIYYQRDVENTVAYSLSNFDKPEHIIDGDWKEIIDIATDRLEIIYKNLSKGSDDEVEYMLQLEKPRYFPDDKWNKLIQSANEGFVRNKKGRFWAINTVVDLLKSQKPKKITESVWREYTTLLKDTYFDQIRQKLEFSKEPSKIISQFDLSLLAEESRKKLEDIVLTQQRESEFTHLIESLLNDEPIDAEPKYLDTWEWGRFRDFEEKKQSIERQSKLIQLVNSVLEREPLGEEADSVTDLEWDTLIALEDGFKAIDQLDKRQQEFEEEKREYNESKKQFTPVKQKVERQLQIINDVLNDPSSVDRLESYDDTFASGNLENLRKLSSYLKESNTRIQDASQ